MWEPVLAEGGTQGAPLAARGKTREGSTGLKPHHLWAPQSPRKWSLPPGSGSPTHLESALCLRPEGAADWRPQSRTSYYPSRPSPGPSLNTLGREGSGSARAATTREQGSRNTGSQRLPGSTTAPEEGEAPARGAEAELGRRGWGVPRGPGRVAQGAGS